jgi:hypothetical protein
MLRLKASEITLTPADVEETLHRMQRRQVAHASLAFPVRFQGPRVSPLFGPRIRRGPERSRDDAVATLGNIPILQPQQVIRASIDESDDASLHPIAPGEDDEGGSDDTSAPSPTGDQTPDAASTKVDVPLPIGDIQLPFRPAPPGREHAPRSTPRGTFSEDLALSPKTLSQSPRFGQERTNSSEDDNEWVSHARIHAATDGQVDDAEPLYTTPTRNTTRSLRQQSSINSSPLQQMFTISSPHHRGGSGDPNSNGHVTEAREVTVL